MKSYVACILYLFLNNALSEDIPTVNNPLLLNTHGSTCWHEGLFGCADDLKGQKYCMFGREIIIDCLTQTGKPECNPETFQCIEKPAEPEEPDEPQPPCLCESPEEYPFLCPRTGFYPHPLNCTKFLICPPAKDTIVSNCHGLVYDPLNEVCSDEVECYTFSAVDGLCKGRDGSIVAHPLNKAIYAYCYGDVPLMGQCPEGQVFNVNKLRCECQKQ